MVMGSSVAGATGLQVEDLQAVVLQVASGQASFHAIVLRGMEWIEGPYGLEPILYVNDPLDYYTRPLPFWQLVDIWEAAIVID